MNSKSKSQFKWFVLCATAALVLLACQIPTSLPFLPSQGSQQDSTDEVVETPTRAPGDPSAGTARTPEISSPDAGRTPSSQQSPVSPNPGPARTLPPQPLPSFPIAGIETHEISNAAGLSKLQQSGAYWVRRNALVWSDVETNEGERKWNAAATLEQEFKTASSQGFQIILIVRGTPRWAQRNAGIFCGPIKPDKMASFGKFMRDAVARYSVAPYNIKYWELGNEPDVDPVFVGAAEPYGCWGDQKDPYYGGGYYAEMLKQAYPQIKSADPQAQVLTGGLLLGCDPRNPPPGDDCKASKFLEGILRANGGAFFDGVSFHAYDAYLGVLGQYSHPGWKSAWNTTGPVVSAKVSYLRGVLSQYGVSAKFLINTESAVICGSSGEEGPCQTKEAANTRASYLAQVMATAEALGLQGNLWYSFFGWRATGLVNAKTQATLPPYDAYRFSAKELRLARYARQIQQYPGVTGHEFERGAQRVWIIWSLDGADHRVSLPSTPRAIFDLFGSAIQTSNSLNVTVMPAYIEW